MDRVQLASPVQLPSPVQLAFDAAADGYDALRRQLIPCFDDFYGAALDALDGCVEPGMPLRVLDVGAGTGLLAALVLARFPQAELTLLDFSEPMLAQARARFERSGRAVRIVHGDARSAPLDGPYDAVASALAIHHFEDADKRRLFVRAHEALRPGGVFVDADNVLAEVPAEHAAQFAAWVEAIRRTGIAEAELAAALERTKVDILSPLRLQLEWLADVGFVDVRCHYAWNHFAVFGGRKPR